MAGNEAARFVMKILITGANGFIGKNLKVKLCEGLDHKILSFVRGQNTETLSHLVGEADAIVHLAGENRPKDVKAFADVNIGLTEELCGYLRLLGKETPILLASSAQAATDNPYGRSKLAAENLVQSLFIENGNPVAIYRLPGVFGKWCKPNYNSVVATFCYNRANDLPVLINEFDLRLRLVYVDDVVNILSTQICSGWKGLVYPEISPEYNISLSELANQIEAFKNSRTTLISERVGEGLTRALYATYVSYLPVKDFAYSVPVHADSRGLFVEMLKTLDSGQFSFFTVHVGATRGGHYHHTKSEKFMILQGRACFRFRHILTNECHILETRGEFPQIVDTVPGWAHDITNSGSELLIVMIWANEIFDPKNPDTVLKTVIQ